MTFSRTSFGAGFRPPPQLPLALAIFRTVRPWAAFAMFFVGALALRSADALTVKNLLLFAWFDFATMLLMNGWNDICDYEIDHRGDTGTKPEYDRLGGWGHAIHHTQFSGLIAAIVVFNLPLYLYGLYVNPVATAVVLAVNVGGNLLFNGNWGLPHTNRSWLKTPVEYWIPITLWGWRVVVTGDADLNFGVLGAYMVLYQLGQLRLDADDIDKDAANGKRTLAVILGAKGTRLYLSVVRFAAAFILYALFPWWPLLLVNVGRAVYFWKREDKSDLMTYFVMLLLIWANGVFEWTLLP